MDNSDASVQAILSSLRSVIIAVGAALTAYGIFTNSEILIASSVIPPVAAALWGLWNAIQKARQKRADKTAAVNATLNLAASGGVLVDEYGKAVKATDAAAEQIMKDYAVPPVVPVPSTLKAVG